MIYELVREIRSLHCDIDKKITKNFDPRNYVNPTQFQILLYLLNNMDEEICQKDIEAETHLKKASITGTLDSLEQKGAIERIQDKNDKRKNLIVLSENALKYKDKLMERIKAVEKQATKDINEEELQQFYETVRKIKNNLKEA